VTLTGTTALAGAAPAAAQAVSVHIGDTLSSIASHNHTTVGALVAANGIKDPDRIVAGTVLQLPGPPPPAASANAQGQGPATNAPGAPLTVVVRLGDTLSSIASHNHTTVGALVSANGIKNANRIVAGTVLRLPVSSWALASYSVPAPPSPSGAGGGPTSTSGLPSVLRAHADRMALFPAFRSAAAAAGVPASLLEAMCWWESGWQAGIVSPTGAIGVCQLEPATTQFVETSLVHGSLDPHIAAQNIRLGAAYFGYLLRQAHGDQQLALAGYYAGLSSVLRHGMSPETKNYVTGILAYARIFAAAG
jgi:LysM repeat protein